MMLGGVEAGKRLLAIPVVMYGAHLIGNESHGARMAPAATYGSYNTAVDMVKRYWMALCRCAAACSTVIALYQLLQ